MDKHRHVRNSLALLTLIPMIRQFILVKELMYDTREIIPDPGDPEPKPVRVPVFYNVYADVARISLATSIIKEQITQLRPEHEVFIRSIGAAVKVENATLIRHDEEGDETGTLGLLWQHCRNHTTDKVVYIHNKGSFHPSAANDKLRRFLTRGALSEECLSMPPSCNICSSRMSPIPHPHTPGNMWLARCEYIKKLINPLEFNLRMVQVYNPKRKDNSCVGTGRYAAEHWIHSHPSNMPCDLSSDDYTWNYDGVPTSDFEMKLEPAPQFEMKKYEKPTNGCGPIQGTMIKPRLKEYESLYPNETVPESWWGWKFFNVLYNNKTMKES
uniref:Uncharacterized protein n=1 Tax=Ditylum brightwellii TaxID=49249 RepID=A0A7S2A067_9STRA|mmetsp:Transcript_5631/g.8547  ORF Transcript_5631/g.8547 Transcript_5631/m.8547 type:complete len:327 (+) Transcript_5631:49-1029(+)